MLIDFLLIYLYATLHLPTWFLAVAAIDIGIRIAALCMKK